ncbi:HD-GYP domain-containing protein [Colwellia sp. MB3u-55]|uniref:HD-GYP domain-containing protein n=1 Tax=Colwellia sp. MB3u-55 TaxID=2759810 RepID=UPI0015F503DA|nr:HD-GYP domain-containing protein [Colwellia sp. MB3u-55]MBA6253065.1 HD-GYP domain-containing protein [Colwellia sp. MB3u-55]
MIVEIEISGLLKGHYVVDIAKQRGAYSLTTPGHIKNIKVIGNLRSRGVESLLIDTSKTLTFDADNNIVGRIKETPLPASNKSPIILEISKAKKLFNQSKEIQRQVFADAQQGRNINLTPVIEITNKTIDTVFKNADALACVINIRKKDEYLLEHSVSVSVLITIFARFLKIDKKIVQLLSVGAFLHDVGKINIPDSILNKPGKLTEAEFTIMKSHVNHSIKIIESTPGISELSLEVAALHHEKLDGTGYPYNIPKEKITKYGRMIAICDIFDALTANRCYKEGYSHIKAFSILRGLAQKEHLDQRLVDLFIKCMGIYPVGSLVELSSNKLAIVESRNDGDPINPNVRSFYNSLDGRYVMAEDINLSDNEDFIIRGVRADDFDLDMNKIIEFILMEG